MLAGGERLAHHELEEEPGVLQDGLTHGTAADHPLQSQLLVKQLEAGAGVTESRGPPYPPLEGMRGENEAGGLGVRATGGHAGGRGQESHVPFPWALQTLLGLDKHSGPLCQA